MSIYKLSLIHKLLHIINENSTDQPNYVLATYFLEHYLDLSNANIYIVAQECFVSRSSVRRFCKSIGYDNFKDFKNECKLLKHDYAYFIQFQEGHKTMDEYSNWTSRQIMSMPSEVDRNISSKAYEKIATDIQNSKQSILLSSYSSKMVLLEFQRPLVLSGKIVNVMSDNHLDIHSMLHLSEDDYLLVVSASGQFAKEIQCIIETTKAHKALITTSRDCIFLKSYDEIYYLSDHDHSNEKSIAGKYGLNYFFDRLYHTYYIKYGTKIIE